MYLKRFCIVYAGVFVLTDDRGKQFTEKHVKNEFAVFLFGALDHPDLHMWLDRFAHCVWRSGIASSSLSP